MADHVFTKAELRSLMSGVFPLTADRAPPKVDEIRYSSQTPLRTREGQSTSVPEEFGRLAAVAREPLNLKPLENVARAQQEGAHRNITGGLMMSLGGGSVLKDAASATLKSGLDQTQLRPNEADVAFVNPDTGEAVVNPSNEKNRLVKSQEFLVAKRMAEEAEQRKAEDARVTQADKLRRDMDMAKLLAGGMVPKIIIANAAVDRAANAGKKGTTDDLTNQQRNHVADLKTQEAMADKAVQVAEANPEAFGLKRGLASQIPLVGSYFANKGLDEEQKIARNTVYNVVSSVMKARAGTAVSAHEKAMVEAFLPAPTANMDDIVANFKAYKTYLSQQRLDQNTVVPKAGVDGTRERRGTIRPAGAVGKTDAELDAIYTRPK